MGPTSHFKLALSWNLSLTTNWSCMHEDPPLLLIPPALPITLSPVQNLPILMTVTVYTPSLQPLSSTHAATATHSSDSSYRCPQIIAAFQFVHIITESHLIYLVQEHWLLPDCLDLLNVSGNVFSTGVSIVWMALILSQDAHLVAVG